MRLRPSCLMLLAMLVGMACVLAQQAEVIVISPTLPKAQSRRMLLSPTAGASCVMIAPNQFLPALLPLARLRQKLGHSVMCVALETVTAHFAGRREEAIQQFLRHACSNWPLPRPRFILLAADVRVETPAVPAIPTWYVHDYEGHTVASDYPYSKGDGEPNTLLVGRLPAHSKSDLQNMVDKIVEYEQRSRPGLWQRRISMFAGPGGYGPVADLLLENIASSLIAGNVPGGYQVTMSYASPASPYFYPPERMAEVVSSRLQEGALFAVYIGHGDKDRFARFPCESRWYSYFGVGDARRLEIAEGFPVMVSLSCLNGCYDDAKDCLGESLMRRRRGPVAFIGASRVSHPYGNVLIGQHLLAAIFDQRLATIGEILAGARNGLVHPPLFDVSRYLLEQSVAYFGKQELPFAEVRLDHAYMYNLLGDPAMRVFFPDFSLPFQLTDQPDGWLLQGNDARLSDCRELVASVELPPDRLPTADTADANIEQRYWRANDKRLAYKTVQQPGATWRIALTVRPLPPGVYLVKLAAVMPQGLLAGWQAIEVKGSDK